jgi:hypothetical protein
VIGVLGGDLGGLSGSDYRSNCAVRINNVLVKISQINGNSDFVFGSLDITGFDGQ